MFSASFLRNFTLAVALSGSTISLSGCGGGSSGPSAPATPTPTPSGTTPTPTSTAPTPTPTPVSTGGGGQLFFDDFTSSTLNSNAWSFYDQYQPLQRTRFGNTGINLKEDGVSFTRLTLDSYNPTPQFRGQFFRGTEINTKSSYTVGSGLEAEARVRAPGLPPGLIAAFFLIRDRYVGATAPANYRKDEIDFEYLTQQQSQFGGRNRLYTNVWNNWNVDLYGYDGDPTDNTTPNRDHDDLVYQPSTNPDYDYANWNIYKIRWYPDRTEFYVNGILERTEREVKPDQALQLHFNFWTPTSDFQQAFNSNLPGPVSTADNPDRRIYQFDVDYVRITALSGGANGARVATGANAVQPLPANAKSYRTLGK